MQTYFSRDAFPKNKYVIALGNFDGVHIGHTALLNEAVRLSVQNGYKSCVYTFSDHPKSKDLITVNSEKENILRSFDIDSLLFDDFSDVCGLDCESFCRDILVGNLGCEIAVCGENYRFGKNRSGDADTLVSEMKKLGKKAVVIGHIKTQNGDTVSSTLIRGLLSDGDIASANRLLGREFSMENAVIHGNHLGTKLGIPTVNQLIPEKKLCIGAGVYSCLCEIDGKNYMGVANVGTKPTVTHGEASPIVLCETHIIGYQGDLYGATLKIRFFERLRDEKKFDSLDALVAEVNKNIARTKEYFSDREDVLS